MTSGQERLLAALSKERPLVFDGAMGTALYDEGIFLNVCYDALSLSHPSVVRDVHERYLDAGAQVIETNTFGANPVRLWGYGLKDRCAEINERAAEIARTAAAGRARVVGAVGPLGLQLEPLGPTRRAEGRAYFAEQIEALAQSGVDGLLLETFSELGELRQAIRAAKEISDLPLLAQITVTRDIVTPSGARIAHFVELGEELGVDVLGVNCSTGPGAILDALERMAQLTSKPLAAQPNAGLPRSVGNRAMYLTGPGYMAQYARRFLEAGARVVGGCCGTTPKHIEAIRREADRFSGLASRERSRPEPSIRLDSRSSQETDLSASGPIKRSLAPLLPDVLEDGRRAVGARLPPPGGWSAQALEADARALLNAGVDFATIGGGGRSGGMASLAAAGVLSGTASAPVPFLHYGGPGKRPQHVLGDLKGARALGIRCLLFEDDKRTELPPHLARGPDPGASLKGLVRLADRLNRSRDPHCPEAGAGLSIGVLAPWGGTLEEAAERLLGLFDAGASFAVTLPVFDVEAFSRLLERASLANAVIVAGVRPLSSVREAEFLRNEAGGFPVPDRIVDRMKRAPDPRSEGLRIALDIAARLRPLARAIHVTLSRGGPGPSPEAASRIADAFRAAG